jgi:RHS repeat-associated protein
MSVSAATGNTPLNVNTPQASNPSSIFNANNQRTDAGQGYDAAGNVTAMNLFSNLTYDAENRLLTSSAPTPFTHAYDGEGRRVTKTGAGNTTVYVYDAAGRLAAEYSTAVDTPNCITCYLSSDHLGTTRLITDQNGYVVSRHDYLPFGEEIMAGSAGRSASLGFDNPDNVNQKFTGKERDSESGLDYFGARYYGSALGRFSSPDDPLVDQEAKDPQSWNLYSYVRNNPLRNVDRDGHTCSFAKDDQGRTIINNLDGKGCAELYDNTVHGDEPGLLMLAGIGENLTNGANVAKFVSDAGRSAASVLAPQASAAANCLFPGGDCSDLDLAMAAIPLASSTTLERFVTNSKLRNFLTMFNRTGTGVGTGSTADAIREEIKTGVAVGGKFHFTKGMEMRNGLLNLLRSGKLSASDQAVAKQVLTDIQDALSTPRK